MSPKPTPAIAILEKVITAADVTASGLDSFAEFASLFDAIKQLSEEHTTVNGLATIGLHLAEDLGSLYEHQNKILENELASLRPVKTIGEAA